MSNTTSSIRNQHGRANHRQLCRNGVCCIRCSVAVHLLSDLSSNFGPPPCPHPTPTPSPPLNYVNGRRQMYEVHARSESACPRFSPCQVGKKYRWIERAPGKPFHRHSVLGKPLNPASWRVASMQHCRLILFPADLLQRWSERQDRR